MTNELKAPFPYFGGKSKAAGTIWGTFGDVKNYVEPFFGTGAVLLSAPKISSVETVNDLDGFVVNFWRAVANDPNGVAQHADWIVSESDLFARHSWLVRQSDNLRTSLDDPEWFDVKIAGWWVWGACNWIGSGWCSGTGPWVWDGEKIVNRRQLPHLGNAGQGINRKLPHLGNAGQGINRKLPHLGYAGRGEFIEDWFNALYVRLRDVRITCGDWNRVLKDSVTVRHGLTAVFLDPPYEKGEMDYGAGGMGKGISSDVRKWCIDNTHTPNMRIILCGHAGEHDELLSHGWFVKTWKARNGYASTITAIQNTKDETLWCSPSCVRDNLPEWLK